MVPLIRPTALLSSLCLLVLPTAALAEKEKFQFQYESGKPLTYALTVKMSMAMTMEIGEIVQATNMVYTMTYDATLTPTDKVVDGITTLDFKPSNIGGEWDIDSGDSKILMSLKGKHMKGTVNGQQFIDTENGVGQEAADEVKKEMMALYLSGQMDVDGLGHVKRFHGDEPFVDFWTEMLAQQVGFFGLVFPDTPLAVGDTWEEFIVIKKMDQIQLEGEGLRCDMTFERLPDAEVDGRKLAQFKLSAPFSHENLKATMEQMGEKTPLGIEKFKRTAGGRMSFDQSRGVFTHSDVEVDADVVMSTVAGGQDLDMDMKLGMQLELKLLP